MQNFVKRLIVKNMHIIILKMKRKNYIVENIKKIIWLIKLLKKLKMIINVNIKNVKNLLIKIFVICININVYHVM